MYHLEMEELRSSNLHLTDLEHLQVGSKIKIPLLNNEVEQILEKTESFVMEYYPKITETISEEERRTVSEEPKPFLSAEPKPVETSEPARQPLRGKAYPGILPPKNQYKGI